MEKDNQYNKIGGWLWLPAIALLVQPVSFFSGSILPFFKSRPSYITLSVNVPVLIGDIIILCFVALVAWFYFTRKKIAPVLFIIKIVFMVLLWQIMSGFVDSQNDPPLIGMMFHTVVIIPYLVLSKRVSATFVEDLDDSIMIEKVFKGISFSLMNFYQRLRNMKAFILLFVIIFLFVAVILNCALRSLRIDGNLMHTFDYF
jgi:hypothetical protein